MLNKIFTICSSVFLIFALNTPGVADEHFPFLAEVSKESVNVRSGPNTNFEKVDKLNKGAQVVVLGRSYEWYKIQPLPTTKMYIRSDYLKIKDDGQIAEVIGDNVNVRSSANSDTASLGELKEGSLVRVLEQANGWCRVAPVAGTAAWIHQDFLKEVSADVPDALLIPTIIASTQKEVKYTSRVVVEKISLQGKLQALTQSPEDDVHYEIAIDNKSIYYVQDIPQITFFDNTVVALEGTVVPDPQKKLLYPLLHINKISLVL